MRGKGSFLQSVIVAGMFLATFYCFDQLPAMIPIHWNFRGEIDGYGPRATIYGIPVVMLVLQTLMGLVLRSLDGPEGTGMMAGKPAGNSAAKKAVTNITTSTLVFMALIQGVMIATGTGSQFDVVRIVCAGVCLLMMFVGRQMPFLPRNFWAGIRTPWTLASDYVWTETHRRAGPVMSMCGMAGAALALVPWKFTGPWLGLLVAVGGALYPVYDSWRISAGGQR